MSNGRCSTSRRSSSPRSQVSHLTGLKITFLQRAVAREVGADGGEACREGLDAQCIRVRAIDAQDICIARAPATNTCWPQHPAYPLDSKPSPNCDRERRIASRDLPPAHANHGKPTYGRAGRRSRCSPETHVSGDDRRPSAMTSSRQNR